jgi:protein gp37
MSDLFHTEIPSDFIDRVFDTMERASWHVFQVLTKRSSLLRRYIKRRYSVGAAPPHIWLGVTVEDRASLSRIRHLVDSPASVRFVSFEPLLESLGRIDLGGIHWAIAGGESGPLARPVEADWIRSIRDQCHANNVAFFFKQWGGVTPKAGGNRIDGRRWLEYPHHAVA